MERLKKSYSSKERIFGLSFKFYLILYCSKIHNFESEKSSWVAATECVGMFFLDFLPLGKLYHILQSTSTLTNLYLPQCDFTEFSYAIS